MVIEFGDGSTKGKGKGKRINKATKLKMFGSTAFKTPSRNKDELKEEREIEGDWIDDDDDDGQEEDEDENGSDNLDGFIVDDEEEDNCEGDHEYQQQVQHQEQQRSFRQAPVPRPVARSVAAASSSSISTAAEHALPKIGIVGPFGIASALVQCKELCTRLKASTATPDQLGNWIKAAGHQIRNAVFVDGTKGVCWVTGLMGNLEYCAISAMRTTVPSQSDQLYLVTAATTSKLGYTH